MVVDDKSVTTSKIASGAVTTESLADTTVTSAKLASGAAADNLGANSISALELQDNSVLQNTIKDQAVTSAKLDTTLSITNATITNTTITTLNTAVTNVVVFNANNVTLGEVGSSATINLAQGTFFSANQTDNCTWTFSNPPTSDKATGFILELTSGGGNTRDAYTTTWPASVKWPENEAPELTKGENAVDVLVFVTDDGGTIYRGVRSMANSGGLGTG